MLWPCETRTSTCRSFATISSGLHRFLAITVLLDVKDIPQVGPLRWGLIKLCSRNAPSISSNWASVMVSDPRSLSDGLRIVLAVFESRPPVGLPNRHANRQRLAIGCLELDNVRAVALRPVDHDSVLTAYRRFLLPH